jgi:hypothetical protein
LCGPLEHFFQNSPKALSDLPTLFAAMMKVSAAGLLAFLEAALMTPPPLTLQLRRSPCQDAKRLTAARFTVADFSVLTKMRPRAFALQAEGGLQGSRLLAFALKVPAAPLLGALNLMLDLI